MAAADPRDDLMDALLYREDIAQVYDCLTTWWQGGDIGRPAMQLTIRRDEPIESIPQLPVPPSWVTHYSTGDFAYRANLAARACIHTQYLGEAVPHTSPDLGPNCLAREQLDLGAGKFLTAFPDLIEGLDTLAAMRGTQQLLIELLERPAWMQQSLRQITELYFRYYDALYHKTLKVGKKLALLNFAGLDQLRAFKREFGPLGKQCLIRMQAESPRQARRYCTSSATELSQCWRSK